MKQYRRREQSDTWHWHRTCSKWPTSNYELYTGNSYRPTYGEFCNECKAKDKK